MVLGINENITSSIFSSRKISRKSVEKILSKKEDGSSVYAILLNKTFSTAIVDYAQNLSSSVLDLKDSSKELSYFIDEYKTVEDKINLLSREKKQKVNEMFEDKVNEFTENYNTAIEFAYSQKHSKSLLDFSNELLELRDEYKNAFYDVGIYDTDSTIKNFDITNVQNMDSIVEKLNCIKSFVDEIYYSTQSMLNRPMSDHMNFRGLSYYYNYKLDRYESNTFELIESGMIIDVAL